jgi:hypothetical protein
MSYCTALPDVTIFVPYGRKLTIEPIRDTDAPRPRRRKSSSLTAASVEPVGRSGDV